jgi:hypothetical protein
VKGGRCDVLVAGGGPAGVAAAVSAARAGASVLLVEKECGLGGNVRAARVHSICGVYREDGTMAHGGFVAEFAGRMLRHGRAKGPEKFGRVQVLLHDPAGFAALCEQMVRETPGIEWRAGCEITGARVEGRNVVEVTLSAGAGAESETVIVGAVVESTGDGNFAARAGLSWDMAPSGELQRPAYIFEISPVDEARWGPTERLALTARVIASIRDGRLPEEARGFVIRPTGWPGRVRVTLDLSAGGGGYDPLGEQDVVRLTREAEATAGRLADFLREEVAAFAGAAITDKPLRVGIRESRRVRGRHIMTGGEILESAVPADTVCGSAWPMEMHEDGKVMRLVHPRSAGGVAGVPLRALQACDVDNVFLAGRCVSCTHEAQAALRVIATSFATGQAAGLAAAAVAGGREILPSEIWEACRS